MATPPPAPSGSLPLRQDFSSSDLNVPLKSAPIVSLRALEHGDDEYDDADLSEPNTFWRRVLMSVRRRRNGKQPLPEHVPLMMGDEKPDVVKRRKAAKRNAKWACIAVPVLVLCFFGVVHLVNVWMTLVPVLLDDDASFLPKWGHPGYLGEGLASYPTDFTRDVIPIQCHSHNDYWRRVPLYEALHFGCVGVEADVWLFDNELFVGHNTMSLTKNRTFRSMYVDPLAKLLDQQNTGNEFSTPSSTRKHSVFDTSPNQTLVLLVDFKNDGHSIFPVVEEHLSALQEKGYLTYFDGENLVRGAITVVATGNAPFDLISANTTTASPRTIFFDAPLDRLSSSPSSSLSHQTPPPPHPRRDGQGTVGTTPTSTFSTANSYYASVSFASSIGRIWGARLSSTQLERIRSQIRSAHARGLKVRYWATPQWPVGLRNHVWDVLVKEGADYLNGDDLAGMTRVDWGVRKHGGWL